MTEMLSRIAWVEEDTDLVDRLDEVWEKWREEGDEGLIAKLDEDESWYGWADWTDDEKRERLTTALDEWFPSEEEADEAEDVDRLAWVREDDALVARLDENWQGWDATDETGLLATLDEESDWSGWDDWSDDDKREFLGTTLDGWYPPADGAADEAAEVDRLAWVDGEPALVARLDANWEGWRAADESGLLAVLDGDDAWSGWGEWTDEDKRGYLATTLDTWYPAEQAEDELEAAPPVAVEPDAPLDAPAVEIEAEDATTDAPEQPVPSAEEHAAAEALLEAGFAQDEVDAVGELVEEVNGAAMDELQASIPQLAEELGLSPEELAEVIAAIPDEEFSGALTDAMTTQSGA